MSHETNETYRMRVFLLGLPFQKPCVPSCCSSIVYVHPKQDDYNSSCSQWRLLMIFLQCSRDEAASNGRDQTGERLDESEATPMIPLSKFTITSKNLITVVRGVLHCCRLKMQLFKAMDETVH